LFFKVDYSSNSLTLIRKLLRFTSLNKLLVRILYGKGYEKKVDDALIESIRKSDIVWDIGANIGLYTKIFSRLVGISGMVFAFEPHPSTYRILKDNCSRENIKAINIALSDCEGDIFFSDKKTHTINSIVDKGFSGKKITVKVNTADNIIIRQIAKIPNVIKIDVEGFELSVIKGMGKVLSSSQLRVIVIEIHHKRMEDMNIDNGPRKIIDILELNKFLIRWIDPSHILAYRL